MDRVADMGGRSARATLEGLALSRLRSQAAALKASTWANYQRCVRDLLEFETTVGVRVFPIVSAHEVETLGWFFEWVVDHGVGWGRLANYLAALRSVSRAAGVPDQWALFPQLDDLTEGLKKRHTLLASQKEGVTIGMVTAVLDYWKREEEELLWLGQTRRAHCAL